MKAIYIAQKMRTNFPLRISSVNVTKSAVSYGFDHIYWKLHFLCSIILEETISCLTWYVASQLTSWNASKLQVNKDRFFSRISPLHNFDTLSPFPCAFSFWYLRNLGILNEEIVTWRKCRVSHAKCYAINVGKSSVHYMSRKPQ